MNEDIAAIIWVIGIVAWTIIRWPYRRKARRQETVVDRRSTMEWISLGLTIAGLVVIPALQISIGLFDFSNRTFSPALAWAGLICMISFLYLFHLSHKHLADNWSVSLEIRKDHQLVNTGIYSKVRHPMYTSFWLWGLAQFLLIPNWIAGLTGLASVAFLYFSRIENEEHMMRQQFGTAYDDYCKTTGRLWPNVF
ncbi:MAG: protein-S-isoprenylcysteine O-methyltransferase [Rhizobiaceae bacterium]